MVVGEIYVETPRGGRSEILSKMERGSRLNANTQALADALTTALSDLGLEADDVLSAGGIENCDVRALFMR